MRLPGLHPGLLWKHSRCLLANHGLPGWSLIPTPSAGAALSAPDSVNRSVLEHQQLRHCKWTEVTKPSADALQSFQNYAARDIGHAPEKAIEVRMESQVIFDSCWRRLEDKFGLMNLHVPRETVWLNGAPGAGKGVNAMHILKTRGLDMAICLSSLLVSRPEVREIIDRGDMIPDTLVGDMLLEALLVEGCRSRWEQQQQQHQQISHGVAGDCGLLVDGFPRTAVQVDFLKLLFDKLSELHTHFADDPRMEHRFPRPLFKVVMLYVDEETSIKRQMERAKVASLHNKRVMDAGAGKLWEQRSTDMSIEKCKKRYDIFKTHYSATMRLKQFFPFHLIDSMGSLDETREAISMELRYQSSLDLSEATYSIIRHLPLSRELAQNARQQLVTRLDTHSSKDPILFHKVVDILRTEVIPILNESGMAGRVEYVSDLRLFNDQPRAAQMLLDILTDRGFSASHSTEVTYVPISVDLATGAIKNRRETKHKFTVHWETKGVREMAKAIEIATRMAESAAKDGARISQSFLPPNSPEMRDAAAAHEHSSGLQPSVQTLEGRSAGRQGDEHVQVQNAT